LGSQRTGQAQRYFGYETTKVNALAYKGER
jgi:hypothetical protein